MNDYTKINATCVFVGNKGKLFFLQIDHLIIVNKHRFGNKFL